MCQAVASGARPALGAEQLVLAGWDAGDTLSATARLVGLWHAAGEAVLEPVRGSSATRKATAGVLSDAVAAVYQRCAAECDAEFFQRTASVLQRRLLALVDAQDSKVSALARRRTPVAAHARMLGLAVVRFGDPHSVAFLRQLCCRLLLRPAPPLQSTAEADAAAAAAAALSEAAGAVVDAAGNAEADPVSVALRLALALRRPAGDVPKVQAEAAAALGAWRSALLAQPVGLQLNSETHADAHSDTQLETHSHSHSQSHTSARLLAVRMTAAALGFAHAYAVLLDDEPVWDAAGGDVEPVAVAAVGIIAAVLAVAVPGSPPEVVSAAAFLHAELEHLRTAAALPAVATAAQHALAVAKSLEMKNGGLTT